MTFELKAHCYACHTYGVVEQWFFAAYTTRVITNRKPYALNYCKDSKACKQEVIKTAEHIYQVSQVNYVKQRLAGVS